MLREGSLYQEVGATLVTSTQLTRRPLKPPIVKLKTKWRRKELVRRRSFKSVAPQHVSTIRLRNELIYSELRFCPKRPLETVKKTEAGLPRSDFKPKLHSLRPKTATTKRKYSQICSAVELQVRLLTAMAPLKTSAEEDPNVSF